MLVNRGLQDEIAQHLAKHQRKTTIMHANFKLSDQECNLAKVGGLCLSAGAYRASCFDVVWSRSSRMKSSSRLKNGKRS